VLPVKTFNSDNAFIVGGPGSLTSLVTWRPYDKKMSKNEQEANKIKLNYAGAAQP